MSNNSIPKDERTRNWTFVVYPGDSLPENWRYIATELCIPMAFSPVHDADENPDETQKKVHMHVALGFEGKKSYDQVLEIAKLFGGTIPQPIKSMRSMMRYFVHMDNPEKAQYDKSDIRCFGGFELESYFMASTSEKSWMLKEMYAYIKAQRITNYADFVDYCMEYRFEDWGSLINTSCSLAVQTYIKANSYRDWKNHCVAATSTAKEVICIEAL